MNLAAVIFRTVKVAPIFTDDLIGSRMFFGNADGEATCSSRRELKSTDTLIKKIVDGVQGVVS